MTDISIIIVSYKGWSRLTKCLTALNSFSHVNFTTEVIVVDNLSQDDTILKIGEQFPRFRFLHNIVNGGFGNGCNLGAGNASGKFLLFLNPDTVVSESELGKLIMKAEQNPSWTVLSCRQVNEKGKECVASGSFPQFRNLTGFQRAVFRKIKHNNSSESGKSTEEGGISETTFPDWISGSVVLIRKEQFKVLNGFDEDFWMYFEDVDLCRRVRNNAGLIAFCRNITIEHNHGGSSRINLKTTSVTKTEVHISRHVYISKHKTGFTGLLIQTFLVMNNIISGGIMATSGLLLFFVPKIFARTLMFMRLIQYYYISVTRLSWISPRSVNFTKKSKINARAVPL